MAWMTDPLRLVLANATWDTLRRPRYQPWPRWSFGGYLRVTRFDCRPIVRIRVPEQGLAHDFFACVDFV